ncbi:hypothetical protein BHYA_0091g00400 [Botrytis hyacinthi]|uniref:Uncharacterized protein n=1 Tax=Botrytis hyacinthi TaxID=278943 RepID=A0A4Z1GLG4_9HELO|nr:hypothetical protein BHYA_0091g00400 [Botrytis hyacinthi]
MPLNPIQKSKLANKPTPNDRAKKQSSQAEHIEAWRHDVPGPYSEFITESRKTSSRTKRSQTSGSSKEEPDWFTHIESGGYFESSHANPTRSSKPPPIKLSQELRQSYSETQDSQDPSTPPPALTFSKEQADYYDNISSETRKTYGYPVPAKAFKIPRKPLQRHQYNLGENIKVKIGKNPNFVRPQTTNTSLQANPPRPHSREKSSSSQNSHRSGPPLTPSKMNMEDLKREFSDFEHIRPREEYQKLQQTLKEIKHAQPQTVTANELRRYRSVAGSICHEPSRRSSMQFSEPSHSRPGSSRIHLPVEQFQTQGLSLEMLENQYYSLEEQDRQNKEHNQSSARSHKPRAVHTPQSPREIHRIEARPLPPTSKPHRSSEVPVHSSARSQRPRIPSTPTPIENIRQLETGYSPRIRIMSSSHQPAETPSHPSVRSYRPRAPSIPRPSENKVRLETGFPQRFPISHQPPTRPHRPPTPLTPKPPQRTVHFEERPWHPPPNTLKKPRRPPLKLPQPLSDKVKPRPPGKKTEKKRQVSGDGYHWNLFETSYSSTLRSVGILKSPMSLDFGINVLDMDNLERYKYDAKHIASISSKYTIRSSIRKPLGLQPPHHAMPEEKAHRVSKYTEDIDGPIKRPPNYALGPRPPVQHKIKRKPVPPKIIPPPVTPTIIPPPILPPVSSLRTYSA